MNKELGGRGEPGQPTSGGMFISKRLFRGTMVEMTSLQVAQQWADAALGLCRGRHEWETVAEKAPFRAVTMGHKIVITPHSSGAPYDLKRSELVGAFQRIHRATAEGVPLTTNLVGQGLKGSYIMRLYNAVLKAARD